MPIKGLCMQMCPKEEINMRKSQKLVHQLERNPYKMVKSFSRSAAGRLLNKSHLLRPPSVLNTTISYLVNEVLKIKNIPFNVIYDFIDDRLCAIRQDATIQEVSNQDWIEILLPIIRFYAYAFYKCHECDLNIFDPVLNKLHFQECILKVVKILLENPEEFKESLDKLSSEVISLLIVANLGDHHILQLVLPFLTKKLDSLQLCYLWDSLIKKAMLLSVNIINTNFDPLFKSYNEFPKIHQCIINVQLPMFRKYILKSMSYGFNCKNNIFPISILTKMLLHNENQETIQECKHYGIKVIDDKVELSKSSFKSDVDELRLKKKIEFNVNVSTMILNT